MHFRLVQALAAAAAVGLLTSCSAAGTSRPAAVQDLLGQQGGSITIWAGEDVIPGLEAVAGQYEADTGVEVEFVQREATAQMISDFITQVPTGQAPDLIISPHDNLGQLVANGVVAPVEIGDHEEEFADIAMEALTYEGSLYGVPIAIENVALVRNNALTTSTPATFDELVAEGRALMAAGRADYPVVIPQSPETGDPYHLYPLQTSFGAPVFEQRPDGSYSTELAMGGASGQRFAEYLGRLGEQGAVNTALTPDIGKEAFIAGRSPYIISGPWNVADMEAAGMDITALPVPSAGGEPARPFVGVQAFLMNSNSKNPLATNDFLANYLTRPEAQLSIFESIGRPPASLAAIESIRGDEVRSAFADIAAGGLPMPAIPEMGSVWSFWGTTENGIVDRQGDPVQLWDRMISNIQNQID